MAPCFKLNINIILSYLQCCTIIVIWVVIVHCKLIFVNTALFTIE